MCMFVLTYMRTYICVRTYILICTYMCKYMRTYICYYNYMYERTYVPSNVHMKLFCSIRVQRDISFFLEKSSILESRSFQGPSRGNRVQRDISRSWELVADNLTGFYFMPSAGCPTNMFAGQYLLVAHHNVYNIVQSVNFIDPTSYPWSWYIHIAVSYHVW